MAEGTQGCVVAIVVVIIASSGGDDPANVDPKTANRGTGGAKNYGSPAPPGTPGAPAAGTPGAAVPGTPGGEATGSTEVDPETGLIKGADPGAAFAGFLAAHLGCPAAAVISPDLGARLVAAGVPADLATRAAALLEDLVAARYGGSAPGEDAAAAARAMVEELEATFRPETDPAS